MTENPLNKNQPSENTVKQEQPDASQSAAATERDKRRGFMKTSGLAAGAFVATQTDWSKPLINSVLTPAHAQTSAPATVVDVAVGAAPEFTTLVQLVTDAGLVPTLQGAGPFTVFAPTNAAFDAISATLGTLSADQVSTVLQYHVLAGVQTAAALPTTTGAASTVVGGPIEAQNGVVFIIDQVLIPAGL